MNQELGPARYRTFRRARLVRRIVPRADVERIIAIFRTARNIELEGLEYNLMLTDPDAVSRAVPEHLPRPVGAQRVA